MATTETNPSEGIRIKTHPSLCQGWGQCHRWAPDIYPLDAAGHIDVHVLEVSADRARDAELGALACPDHAISIIRANEPARSAEIDVARNPS